MTENNQDEMRRHVRSACRKLMADLVEGDGIPLEIVLTGIHCEAIAGTVDAFGGRMASQVSRRAAECVEHIPSRESYELTFSLPPAPATDRA